MYELYIGNKTYSSWSLRPWVLMKALNIEFTERAMQFNGSTNFDAFRKFSPSGRVPCLVHDGEPVWDSLAIAEYLAERHPGVWPTDAKARAWARCASAEMHSGFGALRETASMCCGVRVQLTKRSAAFERDVARINELWTEGVTKFGGPFLAGKSFTAVDAMFAPVAFRIQGYGLELNGAGAAVTQTLLGLAPMKQWYTAAIAETFRDVGHEADLTKFGTLLEDIRAR